MFYTVYKTTNLINGKFYIGKHQTKVLNDDYMGSGKLIRRAFTKYGIENFAFEYLGIFDQEWKMNLAEKIYVVLDPEASYNLCPGGQGGFGYINANPKQFVTDKKRLANRRNGSLGRKVQISKMENEPLYKEKVLSKRNNSLKERYSSGHISSLVSLNKDPEFRSKRKAALHGKQSGKLNSQFGTCWITNEVENKKIKKEDLDIWISRGYRKGRFLEKSNKEQNVI